LFLLTSDADDIMNVLLAVTSAVLAVIAVNAYRKRPSSRYFFLMLAFGFLLAAQAMTLYQDAFYGGLTIAVPYLELDVAQFLELLMCVSLVVALFKWSQLRVGHRETVLKGLVVALGLIAVLSSIYATQVGSSQGDLPPGCSKQPGGYLIVASDVGYNDSAAHGVPASPWPVITVKEGSTVNLTICNSDNQAHGFNINYYYDSVIKSIAPGQVVHLSFVADQKGIFQIYCAIFCPVHVFMQSGEIVVD
jgi:hypothetical protein